MKPEVVKKILERCAPYYHVGNQPAKLGVWAAMAAMDALGIEEPKHAQLMIQVETMWCFADTLKEACLCAYKDVELKNYGKMAFTMINKRTGDAVRVSITPKLQQEMTKMFDVVRELTTAGRGNDAGAYAGKYFDDLINRSPEGLLKIEKVNIDKEVLRRPIPTDYGEKICSNCGESVSELCVKHQQGRFYCEPCFRANMKRLDQLKPL